MVGADGRELIVEHADALVLTLAGIGAGPTTALAVVAVQRQHHVLTYAHIPPRRPPALPDGIRTRRCDAWRR